MRITILLCLYLIASENVFAMPEHTQCLIVLKWLHTIKLILSIKAHIENCGGKKMCDKIFTQICDRFTIAAHKLNNILLVLGQC